MRSYISTQLVEAKRVMSVMLTGKNLLGKRRLIHPFALTLRLRSGLKALSKQYQLIVIDLIRSWFDKLTTNG